MIDYTKEHYTTAQKQAECIVDYHLQKLRESILPVIERLVVEADITKKITNQVTHHPGL